MTVQFPQGKMYDSRGNIAKCSQCDKNAGISIMGKDIVMHYCSEHFYGDTTEANFVYNPSSDAKISDAPSILKDSWTVTFRNLSFENENKKG